MNQIAKQTNSQPVGQTPWLPRMIARHRRCWPMRKLAGLCRRYLLWDANVSYDLDTNGEGFVLNQLNKQQPAIIFDAGANIGDWSLAAASRCPSATIHAFEISEPTYEKLKQAVASHDNIHPVQSGLSDQPGHVELRHYPEYPALTTATDYPHPFNYETRQANVTTGDIYCEQQGITHIDMLKIDVEGMEPRVLEGFRQMFENKAIDLVQFEYGRVSITHKFLLKDFYDWLEPFGYRLGKIYPNYIDFRDYDMSLEDFLGPNYLACLTDRTELLSALSGQEKR